MNPKFDIPIKDLNLCNRCINSLLGAGFNTLLDFLLCVGPYGRSARYEKIRMLKNIGYRHADEISDLVDQYLPPIDEEQFRRVYFEAMIKGEGVYKIVKDNKGELFLSQLSKKGLR